MRSIIYDSGYLKTLCDYIKQTFISEIEKYPQITEHYKQMIEIRYINSVIDLAESCFERHKGHFTRKYVQESCSSYRSNAVKTSTCFKYDNCCATCYATEIYLTINMERFLIDCFIDMIPSMSTKIEDHIKHVIKISARHEVGHILDWIINKENRHIDHVNHLRKIEDDAICEFNSIMDNLSNEEYTIKYYQLPGERRANELVGLTPQDFLFKSEKEN